MLAAVSRFAFIAAIACATPALAETAYFASINDLPLPLGFTDTRTGSSFDSDAGRIVIVHAEGPASLAAVRDFYDAALPPLGWSFSPQADGAMVFQRGRERLDFSLDRNGENTRLDVRLVVRPASMNAD